MNFFLVASAVAHVAFIFFGNFVDASVPDFTSAEIFAKATSKKNEIDTKLSSGSISQVQYDLSFTTPNCDGIELIDQITREVSVDFDFSDTNLINKCTMNTWLELAIVKKEFETAKNILESLFPPAESTVNEDGFFTNRVDPIHGAFQNRPSPLQYVALLGTSDDLELVFLLLRRGATKTYRCFESADASDVTRYAPDFCALTAANVAFQNENPRIQLYIEQYDNALLFTAPKFDDSATNENSGITESETVLVVILSIIAVAGFVIFAAYLYTTFA